ncbi:hypothetical protein SAMN04489731_13111 [Amycolatopsis regifaucium]|nr:hypothetical protein SAMN04489731_13111 [Amycolatopsis regifaucium]
MTTEVVDRDSRGRRWAQAMCEYADVVARRPPNVHSTALTRTLTKTCAWPSTRNVGTAPKPSDLLPIPRPASDWAHRP